MSSSFYFVIFKSVDAFDLVGFRVYTLYSHNVFNTVQGIEPVSYMWTNRTHTGLLYFDCQHSKRSYFYKYRQSKMFY